MDEPQVRRGLAARRAGRSWDRVAEIMGLTVPQARAALADRLADARAATARRSGAHAPDPQPCGECGCPRAEHTRPARHVADGCANCVASRYVGDGDGRRWSVECPGWQPRVSAADRDRLLREHYEARVAGGGMSRSTLGCAYQLGLGRFTRRADRQPWQGTAPVMQRARPETRYARASRRLREDLASRSDPNPNA